MGTAIEVALKLCRAFEGFFSKPYRCPAGVPTIGYGTTYYEDGGRVTLQDPPIGRERAEQLLSRQLTGIYMRGVLKASPVLIAFPATLGALTSFAYNLGVPRYRASTLRKRIEAKDWDGAAAEIKKWNRASGRVLNGLVRRRAAEAALLGG
jgi:lysozyme